VHGRDPAAHDDAADEGTEQTIRCRLTTNSATADAKMAARSETSTVGQAYCTWTGKRNASMPM